MQEKINIKNEKSEILTGILNNGRYTEPMLIFVHGFAGNKDENGLFVDAEQYFSSRNINTFRFDMAGTGESTGNYSETSLQKQARDLELVISTLRKKYHENNISIVGFSLGATVSTLIDQNLVNQYIFWSPSLFTAKDMFPRYNTEAVLSEIKEKGFLDKEGVHVGTKIIRDLKEYNPVPLLKEIHAPVLLIHGTADPRLDYKSTITAQKILPNAKFIKIEGANHSYKNNPVHRKQLFDATYSWLIDELKK